MLYVSRMETTTQQFADTDSRALIRFTFEVHSATQGWNLYRITPAGLVFVSHHNDKRAAVKAGEAL